ncbi:MAG: type I-D CRISPR-associated protein Cas5/Csc1 [Atribacterota bacterium]
MKIYEYKIELMEDLMFVSTEYGNEYKAYGFIGNTALPYALGLIPVHHKVFKKPQYLNHFSKLNERGIFLTPVTFLGNIEYKLERFNCMPETHHLTWSDDSGKGRTKIYPDEGWWRMISKGNRGIFYVLTKKKLNLPKYIRVGKFMSKCKIEGKEVNFSYLNDSEHYTNLILRAEDISPKIRLKSFIRMDVPNSCYLKDIIFQGKGIEIKSNYIKDPILPLECKYNTAIEGIS